MAGIGFQLRRILKTDSFFNFMRAYGYASVLSSGPWLLAVFGIVLISFIKYRYPRFATSITQFQTSITYLFAASLILSGLAQFSFTRFISDLVYAKRENAIIPTYCGALLCTTILASVIAFIVDAIFFINTPTLYRLLMAFSFIVLCGNWLSSSLLSGLKAYRAILIVFFLGYALIVALGYWLYAFGLVGLMLAFFTGQVLLLAGMIFVLFRSHFSQQLMSFEFLRPGKLFISLVLVGLFYNLAIWIDKIVFWFSASTGMHVIGPLFASPIYDLPIFFSYLTMIPGMAVFLFRLETDFVEYYDQYYNAIRSGDSLTNILNYRQQMVSAAYFGVVEIAKVQGFMIVLMFLAGKTILHIFGVSIYYAHILNVATIAAALQVILLGLLNILFYLDKRHQAVLITVFFFVTNLIFTIITVHLGVYYYAYGLAASLLMSNLLAFFLLDYDFRNLEYMTFMLR
ncbi:MAG: exopolysaccharide Pel transporter PelG [Coxiellaceae bacterium]|nr:exopolysaccharide Pel transporter PelG [Coxiellaceae bacterium]